jgi:hypothetical protein
MGVAAGLGVVPFGPLGGNGTGGGGGGGSTQKPPQTFKVGTTPNAPVAGSNTWTNALFANSYVVIFLARSVFVDLIDAGDGSPYISKVLASTTLQINNYPGGWIDGDVISIIIITP